MIADLDVDTVFARIGIRPRRVTADSRRVEPGVAFAAYPGAARDGRAFIADALARGAAAVLWEPHDFEWNAQWRAPNAPVRELKHALGGIADVLYGSPSR